MLRVHGLSYAYADRPPIVFPDLDVAAGAAVGLVGPSGSGKSTLLMLIAGLLDATPGCIRVDGLDPALMTGAARDRFRARTTGVVLQSFALLSHLSVLENLAMARYLAGGKSSRAELESLLQSLGIAQHRHDRPARLSTGQSQRAAIARAIVNRPRLLLADEPTSSLDDVAAEAAMGLLLAQSRRLGAALLVATHDRRITQHLDRIVALHPREDA